MTYTKDLVPEVYIDLALLSLAASGVWGAVSVSGHHETCLRCRGRSYRQGFDPPWAVYNNSQIANS